MTFIIIPALTILLLILAVRAKRKRQKENASKYGIFCLIHLQRKLIDTNYQPGILYLFDPDNCEECKKYNL